MDDALYQRFLDWLRRRDTVVLKLEDGTELAAGFRPRTAFEEHDAAMLRVRSYCASSRVHVTSLRLLEQRHGPLIAEFLAEVDDLWERTQEDRSWLALDRNRQG